MSGDNGFKGKLFGGFDRRDVVEYIEKLAGERNDLKVEKLRLQDEKDAWSAREEAMQAELEALRAALDEKENQLSSLREEMETANREREALESGLNESRKQAEELEKERDKAREEQENQRICALDEAAELLEALFQRCEELTESTGGAADRVNGEFWKVTAAMEDYAAKLQEAGAFFRERAEALRGEKDL